MAMTLRSGARKGKSSEEASVEGSDVEEEQASGDQATGGEPGETCADELQPEDSQSEACRSECDNDQNDSEHTSVSEPAEGLATLRNVLEIGREHREEVYEDREDQVQSSNASAASHQSTPSHASSDHASNRSDSSDRLRRVPRYRGTPIPRCAKIFSIVLTLFFPYVSIIHVLQAPIVPPCHVRTNPNDLVPCALSMDLLRALGSFPYIAAADEFFPSEDIRGQGLIFYKPFHDAVGDVETRLRWSANLVERKLSKFTGTVDEIAAWWWPFSFASTHTARKEKVFRAFEEFGADMQHDFEMHFAGHTTGAAVVTAEFQLCEIRKERRQINDEVQRISDQWNDRFSSGGRKNAQYEKHQDPTARLQTLRSRLLRILVAEASITCWTIAHVTSLTDHRAWLYSIVYAKIPALYPASTSSLADYAGTLNRIAKSWTNEYTRRIAPNHADRRVIRQCAKDWASSVVGWCLPRCEGGEARGAAFGRRSSRRQQQLNSTEDKGNDTSNGNGTLRLDPEGKGCTTHPDPVWWAWHNAVPLRTPHPAPLHSADPAAATEWQRQERLRTSWARFLGLGRKWRTHVTTKGKGRKAGTRQKDDVNFDVSTMQGGGIAVPWNEDVPEWLTVLGWEDSGRGTIAACKEGVGKDRRGQ